MKFPIAETIWQQLTYGVAQKIKVMTWGTTKVVGTADSITFTVNGLKHKGTVKITYMAGSDDYKIEYFKEQQTEPCRTVNGMYFDELNDEIDNFVEYTGDVESYLNGIKSEELNGILKKDNRLN